MTKINRNKIVSPCHFKHTSTISKPRQAKLLMTLRSLLRKKGLLQKGEIKDGVKAGEIVAWLKKDFDIGHGHAMAIYAVFKGIKK